MEPVIYTNPENYCKATHGTLPGGDMGIMAFAVYNWAVAQIDTINIDKMLKSKKTAQQAVLSIRSFAETAASWTLSDDTELGSARAFLFAGQILAKRPLGFNLSGFPLMVSHPPFPSRMIDDHPRVILGDGTSVDLKKGLSDAIVRYIKSKLDTIGTPEGMTWSVSVKSEKGPVVCDGLSFEDSDIKVFIHLSKPFQKGYHKTAPRHATTPKGEQRAAGGGGGGPSPKTPK